MDLISALTWKNFDFYLGAGPATVSARFSPGIVLAGESLNSTSSTVRNYAGITYEWGKYFFATEYHRIRENTYALKLGFRL